MLPAEVMGYFAGGRAVEEVEIGRGASACLGIGEIRMSLGHMVGHEVHDHAHSPCMRLFDQVPQVRFAADVLTQAKMIDDFIAEFTWESCSDRQEPERVHPQPCQLIQ